MKIIHSASKGTRINYNWLWCDFKYGSELSYCKSHKLIFNNAEQEKLLSNGKACIYTDKRFGGISGHLFLGKTTKAIKRNSSKIRNISGVEVPLTISNRYRWVSRKGAISRPTLSLTIPTSTNPVTFNLDMGDITKLTDPKVIQITQALMDNGYYVTIFRNTSFITGDPINNYIVMAYGENKMVGISEYNDPFRGYGYGCDNILWDFYDEFDKWSRCYEIPKTTKTTEIIELLKVVSVDD